ncbi:MAG TPA: DUF2312 domain-containing protein [Terracidiphilus sp.]|jgi:uncharacterized protein (UPF0335 family)
MTKSGFAREHLKSFIERVERLESEKSALVTDIREVYSEAASAGFDTKIMRHVVRLREEPIAPHIPKQDRKRADHDTFRQMGDVSA